MARTTPLLLSCVFYISIATSSFITPQAAFGGQSIAPLTSAKTPLPVPADVSSLEYSPDKGHLEFTSPSNFKDVTAFYREQMKTLGWTEAEPLTETDNQETLKFTKGDDDWVILDLTTSGTGTFFVTEEPSLANKGEKITSVPAGGAAQTAQVTPPAAETPAPSKVPLAMPDDAAEVAYDGNAGSLAFSSAMTVRVLADFYRAEAKKKGWSETPSVINKDNMSVLTFTSGEDALGLTIMALGNKTQVEAEGSFLENKGNASTAAASSDASSQPATDAPALVAVDRNGLPLPDGMGNSGSSSSMFSKSVNFSAPNSVADVVNFYRTELKKKGWKEDNAAVSESKAELTFTAPEGPAKLTVARNGDMSDAELTLNEKAKAANSPLAAKPGKVKIMFGNMSDKEAIITIGGKKIKIPAGADPRNNGVSLDLAPGELTASMKGAKENFKAEADTVWIVGIGPGGLMVMQQ